MKLTTLAALRSLLAKKRGHKVERWQSQSSRPPTEYGKSPMRKAPRGVMRVGGYRGKRGYKPHKREEGRTFIDWGRKDLKEVEEVLRKARLLRGAGAAGTLEMWRRAGKKDELEQ